MIQSSIQMSRNPEQNKIATTIHLIMSINVTLGLLKGGTLGRFSVVAV